MTTLTTTPDTIKATYPVTGMSCASCAMSVESRIKSQSGIVSAAVNFAGSSILIEFNPELTDPTTLKKAVQGIGYDLLIKND